MYTSAELVAFGNPIMDHFAFPSVEERERLIKRFGLPSGGARHIEIDEIEAILAEASPHTSLPGGGAFNTARLYAQLGGKAAFYGSVGSDGEPFHRELSQCGMVDMLHIENETESGRSLALITSGRPVILLVAHGASRFALPVRAELMQEATREKAFSAEIPILFYLEGFLLFNTELIRSVLIVADKLGARLAFDPGAPQPAASKSDLIHREILPRCDYLFATEEQLEALGRTGSELTEHFGVKAVVEKRGKSGSLVYSTAGRQHVPPYSVQVYETTGTGDLYAGAFLAALHWEKGIREAATAGARAGAYAAELAGGRLDPSRIEVLRFVY